MSTACLFFEGNDRLSSIEPPEANYGAEGRQPMTAEAEAFFADVFARGGLRWSAYRPCALHRRLAACLRHLRVRTIAEARARLTRQPELQRSVLGVALLGVSEFFRDAGVFARLEQEVVPRLISTGQPIRVWSAGCSSGQELLSIAMLISDAGGLERATLLGTDCRSAAIDQARAGVYPASALASLSAERVRRFFTRAGQAAVVRIDLRRRAQWKVQNLFSGAAPGPWNLILWRNMAIYVETHELAALWRSVCAELAPGGYLVVGKADHPVRGLPLVRLAAGIYQKAEGVS